MNSQERNFYFPNIILVLSKLLSQILYTEIFFKNTIKRYNSVAIQKKIFMRLSIEYPYSIVWIKIRLV